MSVYTEFFNFKEEPFKLTPDPDFFYCSTSHEEAIQLIEYSIKTRKGFMALIGEVGTGKTTLTRVLLNSLTDVETCLVLNPFLSPEEMIRYICSDFGITIPKNYDKGKIYNKLTEYLLKLYEENKYALLIIDESQNLSLETIELIRQLSNIEKEDAKLLQILFVGQPEFLEMLNKYELSQVKQRISTIIQLKSLTLDDVENYVNFRISKASKYNKAIFTKNAIKAIYKYTGGNPRDINKLCEYALIAAYNDKSKKIDKKHIDEAFIEVNPTLVEYTKSFKTTSKNTSKFIITGLTIIALFLIFLLFENYCKIESNKNNNSNIINNNSLLNKKDNLTNSVKTKEDNHSKEIVIVKTETQLNKTLKTNDNISVEEKEFNQKDKIIKNDKQCILFKVNQKVRIKPDLNSPYLTIMKKNSKVEVIKIANDWAMISIDNNIGWVLIYDKYNQIVNCEVQ